MPAAGQSWLQRRFQREQGVAVVALGCKAEGFAEQPVRLGVVCPSPRESGKRRAARAPPTRSRAARLEQFVVQATRELSKA